MGGAQVYNSHWAAKAGERRKAAEAHACWAAVARERGLAEEAREGRAAVARAHVQQRPETRGQKQSGIPYA